MVRAWMTQEMVTEALSAVAYIKHPYIQISAQTSLAAAVVDMWQRRRAGLPLGTCGMDIWHGRPPNANSNQKAKRNLTCWLRGREEGRIAAQCGSPVDAS